DEVVLRALEQKPDLRYQQASVLKTAVETIVSTEDRRQESGGVATEKPPRISRTAMVGAVWALFVLGLLPMVFVSYQVPAGQEPTGPAWWQILLMILLIPAGLTAPFGTTLLGWIAVAQIRRSAGKLYGLGLAVFDGLFFPLLALDGLIGWGVFLILESFTPKPYQTEQVSYGAAPGGAAVLLITLLVVILADGFIIRRVWRAVKQPLDESRQASADSGYGSQNRTRSNNRRSVSRWSLGFLLAALLGTPLLLALSPFDRWVIVFGGLCALASFGCALASLRVRMSRWIAGSWVIILIMSVLGAMLLHQALIKRERTLEQAVRAKEIEARESHRQNLAEREMDQQAADIPASFGPVIEQVVYDDVSGRDCFVDFDTGKLLTPPMSLKGVNGGIETWVREQGIDAGSDFDKTPGLLGIDMIAIPLDFEMDEAVGHSLLAKSAMAMLTHGKPGYPVKISGQGERSNSYAFQTREGGKGILQITGFSENPRGVKIRYKLVERTSGPATKIDSAMPWGEWTASWRVRLRPQKDAWPANELPTFLVDLQRQQWEYADPDAIRRTLEGYQLEVDGHRYQCVCITTAWERKVVFQPGEIELDFVTLRFHEDQTGCHVRLVDKDGTWINSYELHPLAKDAGAKTFKWSPGKHVVRVLFPSIYPIPQEGEPDDYRPVSNPVEVEVLPYLAADTNPNTFGPVIERDIPLSGACLNLKTGELIPLNDMMYAQDVCRVGGHLFRNPIDSSFSRLMAVDMTLLELEPEDWVNLSPATLKTRFAAQKANQRISMHQPETFLPPGIYGFSFYEAMGLLQVVGETGPPNGGIDAVKVRYKLVKGAQTNQQIAPSMLTTPWGESVSGIRARLRTNRIASGSESGAAPILKFDLQNQSEDIEVMLNADEMPSEILVDGVLYQYHPRVAGQLPTYGPGERIMDGQLILDSRWQAVKAVSGPPELHLGPGTHTVQARFSAFGTTAHAGTPIHILSNPVEITVEPGATQASAEPVQIYLSENGLVTVNDELSPKDQLLQKLKELSATGADSAVIRADRNTLSSKVTELIAMCKSAGMDQVNFGTTEETAFGPVLEQTLKDPSENRNYAFFDFESGRIRSPGGSLSLDDREAVWNWATIHDIDAVANTTSQDVRGLLGYELTAVCVPDETWAHPPGLAEMTRMLLARKFNDTRFGGLPEMSQSVLTVNTVSTDPEQSRTYLFQTSAGTLGLLQFVDYNDSPNGSVKIRYKLMKHPAESDGDAKARKEQEVRQRLAGKKAVAAASQLFHGLDLSAAPAHTDAAGLPDLWEEQPAGSGSYEMRKEVVCVYSGLDGAVYFTPSKNCFYVQSDPVGSSTHTYYGPFEGDPRDVLDFKDSSQGMRVINPAPCVAPLSVGSVELAAVSYYPSMYEPWWRPDGKRVEKELFATEASGESSEDFRLYSIVARLHGLPHDASKPVWRLEPRNSWAEGRATATGAGLAGRLAMISAKEPRSAATMNVAVGIALAPWET
ncbi:MAG: biopolymer transporter ExbD, partial [Deltaproteobacteria bacterium]|nr:biopolymer transporter ExbD [Deltaproteobacteria bacterium]